MQLLCECWLAPAFTLSLLCLLVEKLCTLEERTFDTSWAETKADPALFRLVSFQPTCWCPFSFLMTTASVTDRKLSGSSGKLEEEEEEEEEGGGEGRGEEGEGRGEGGGEEGEKEEQ